MRDKLNEYYDEINKLSDEIPGELSKKIYLYSLSLIEIGINHAIATNNYGRIYAKRKARWGEIAAQTDGSGVVKEATADLETYELRKTEAKAEAEMHRWKHTFIATQEIVNALKVHLKVLVKEMDG